jgi:hypothetical protein
MDNMNFRTWIVTKLVILMLIFETKDWNNHCLPFASSVES